MSDRPWILLDIGNVFLMDEPLIALVWIQLFCEAKRLRKVSDFGEMMTLRESAVIDRLAGAPHDVVGEALLTSEQLMFVREAVIARRDKDFLRYCYPLPGADGVLKELTNDFRLAMAANQPEGSFRQAMEQAGLLAWFDVIGISDEVGLKKPDPAFFRHVLREAGCEAGETVMVGDRIDNDIAPAQAMGMKTVLVELKLEDAGYVPRGELEQQYVESLARVPGRGVGEGNVFVVPDRRVERINELPKAVRKVMAVA